MTEITDDDMRAALATTRGYTAVLLKATPARSQPGADEIVWEHGRRNFSLRAGKKLAIVCPVVDGTELRGICLFDAEPDEVRTIMDEDPAVRAGIFTYEVHAVRSFPGDALPG